MSSTRFFGLTGGIASGKSTVARMFADRGAVVIDADALARQVVAPGQPALAEIEAAFPGVVDAPTQTLDRKKLGSLIFADAQARARLNAITHPRIQALAQALKAGAEARGAKVIIYEAALLIENGLQHQTEGAVLVATDPQTQEARLRERDGLSPEDARARIASQWPTEAKRAASRWVIDNSGTLEATEAQVDAIWAQMTA